MHPGVFYVRQTVFGFETKDYDLSGIFYGINGSFNG